MGRKMKFNNKIFLLIFVFAILSLSIVPVFARGSNSVFIHLKDLKKDEVFPKMQLKIWKISDQTLKDRFSETLSRLEGVSEEDLDGTYKHFVTDPSDWEGLIALSGLEDGTYYAREAVQDKEGARIVPFLICLPMNPEDGKDIYPKPAGGKPPEVDLVKVSTEGEKLAGAVFEVYFDFTDGAVKVPLKDGHYDESGSGDQKLVTDAEGKIHLKLPPGKYFFKEVQAPPGYQLLDRKIYFEVKENEKKVITVENKKKGPGNGHKFLKIDRDSKEPLQGAYFKVTQKEGNSYKTLQRNGKDYILVSDENGQFYVTDLPHGTYYLWETRAPEGYELLNGAVEFEVGENSDQRELVIENGRGFIPKKPGTPFEEEPGREFTPKKPQSQPPLEMTPKRPLLGRGNIPKTGDITLIMMTIAGAVLALTGLNLVKKG